jgi:hypothetical protein
VNERHPKAAAFRATRHDGLGHSTIRHLLPTALVIIGDADVVP